MSKAIFCIAGSNEQALSLIEQLRSAGIPGSAVSALLADRRSTQDFAHETGTRAPEGAVTGLSAGGLLGGTLGWLAGMGALAIPGVGPFLAAGPVLTALGGAVAGAMVGGIAGTLVGMGVTKELATHYERKIHQGEVLVSVHADEPQVLERARRVFEAAGVRDIGVAGEPPVVTRPHP